MGRRAEPAAGNSLKPAGVVSVAAVVSALATMAGTCCVPVLAPLVVSVLGVGGAVWAAGLKPYSPYLLLGSALLLGFGYWSVYRRRSASRGSACPVQPPLWLRGVLWAVTALWSVAFLLNLFEAGALWL